MQKYTPFFILVSLIIGVVFLGCDLTDSTTGFPPDRSVVLHKYTFESPADTAGWHGHGAVQLREDVPMNGGEHSLYVSGGCIVPHFVLDLPPIYTDSYLQLRCWGKVLIRGGVVSLGIIGDSISTGTAFALTDSTWYRYTSETVFYSAGDSIELLLNSGGIVPGGILVDNIEIVKVTAPVDSPQN